MSLKSFGRRSASAILPISFVVGGLIHAGCAVEDGEETASSSDELGIKFRLCALLGTCEPSEDDCEDAGPSPGDAGAVLDGGGGEDAGVSDGGTTDDAGVDPEPPEDGGAEVPEDGGAEVPEDGGAEPPDAGTQDDGGAPDAGGVDAGPLGDGGVEPPDAGADAGVPVGCTSLVNHAPTLDGTTVGSVQMMLGESLNLNSTAVVTENLFVPGTPSVQINGNPNFGGTVDGAGSATPTNYTVLINSGATLGALVRRTDPVPLPIVAPPPSPSGTRSVVLGSPGQDPGDFATLRDLTLNSNAGAVAVPPGTYGSFIANGGSGFVIGVAGGGPVAYDFQNLTLNSGSTLQVVGPVVITLANGTALNTSVGSASRPDWVTIRVASGGLTLNSGVIVYGTAIAPSGNIIVNSASQLHGCIASDRLTINANGLLNPP